MRIAFLVVASCVLLRAADEVAPAHFAAAAAYSRTHGELALRVEQDGKLIGEDYAHGFSATTSHKIYSGTKSFVALAALVAMQDGLLTLDEKASATLPEWRNDRRSSITIDELLSHTSGLNPDGDYIYQERDQMRAAVLVPLVAAPGTQFHYGAVNYEVFGEILRRKLRARHESVEEFIKRRVFDPLDIDIADWKRDGAGDVLIHSGLSLTPMEWAKFGTFINRVRAGQTGEIVMPSSLALLFAGHPANPAYGDGFWLNRPPPVPRRQSIKLLQLAIDGDQLYPGGPRDLVACIGTGHQMLYMIPSLHLVVVRFATGAAFSDGDFLSRLLTGKAHPDAHTH